MSKYGQAAVNAVNAMMIGIYNSPNEAWNHATIEFFGEGTWGQKKGCPKNAFLGLCEEGLLKGVPTGTYNSRNNSKNKGYAIRAVNILKTDPGLVEEKNELWDRVIEGKEMSHNYQMDVVISLWKNGLINC